MAKNLDLSLVIPAKDEEKNIEPLYREIVTELKNLKKTYEIIFVDDGSSDHTFEIIKRLHQKDSDVKGIQLRGNFGKATALATGFDLTKGEVILTLDADLQDNPKEIRKFLNKLNQGVDLVVGWKKVRKDPWHKVLSSRIFNTAVSLLTGSKLHDVNCGFKAFRKEVVQNVGVYGDLFRFIPILAQKQNYRVDEVIINHRPRKYGKTKYGLGRSIKGLLDLITVIFLTGYLQRPGHFFGTLGLISFGTGFIIGLYITYLRITTGSIQYRHPLLFLGMLLMIIGIQLVSTGLLAEMFTNFHQKSRDTRHYVRQQLV